MPSPIDIGAIKGTDPKQKKKLDRKPSDDEKFVRHI